MRGRPVTLERAEAPIIDSMRKHQWAEMLGKPLPAEARVLDDVPFLRSSTPPRGRQPAAYYKLGALALYVTGQEDVDRQLYVVRCLGVLMGALVAGAAYWTARTLLPQDRLFALIVGVVVVLFPQRAFIAAGVNNDNLAILAGSLAFLAIVRLAILGFSLRRGLALGATCVLVFLSKTTAWPIMASLVVLALAAPLRFLARRWSSRTVLLMGVAALAALALLGVAIIRPGGNAVGWSKSAFMPPSRVRMPGPAGPFALRVSVEPAFPNVGLSQALPPDVINRIAGQVVTIGAWVRSPRGEHRAYMHVFDGKDWWAEDFLATEEWTFVARSSRVPEGARNLAVTLHAVDHDISITETVLYQGVLLVEGNMAQVGQSPTLVDGGARVLWTGTTFDNLVEHGLADRGAISFVDVLHTNQLLRRLGVVDRVASIEYLLDPAHYGPADVSRYTRFWSVLFESFWAQFGWMSVRLPDLWYTTLKVLTLLSFVLAIGLLFWRRGTMPEGHVPTLAILMALCTVIWSFATSFLRQIPPTGAPQGRYVVPVIVPFAFVLSWGLYRAVPARLRSWLALGFTGFLIVLNTISLHLIGTVDLHL